MATGQTILDSMEVLNQELQLQEGEADVVRGLRAVNIAQDYFEMLLATRGKAYGGRTGTVVTVANTETTAFPSGVLRIDRLQLLNASTGRPKGDLGRIHRAGGHAGGLRWPYGSLLTTSSGSPSQYWTNGTYIYWSPLPSGAETVRWYGFQQQDDITASGTFAYPDIVILPLASFAAKIMKMGVDDPAEDLSGLAQGVFSSVLQALETFNRDGAAALEYTQVHTE